MRRPILVGFLTLAVLGAFVSAVVGVSSVMRSFNGWMESVRTVDDRPASDDPSPVAFSVHQGATAASVGQDLQDAGVIRSATAFRLQVERREAGSHIVVGDYELRRNMTVSEILDRLTAGRTVAGTMVTIPEGWRAEQVAQRLEAQGVVDASSFLDAVAARSASSEVALPSDATTFEGYLFPDTYDFGRDPTADSVLSTFVGGFRRRVSRSLTARAADRGLSTHQMVTLASIVEREATEADERAEIAAVFENRLALGMPLQADPTVQYAQVPFGAVGEQTFWKRILTHGDLQVDSPYNTYQMRGLPPGPICNPGLASLEAVVDPSDQPWLYFVAKGDGSHLFARTLDEHNQNVSRIEALSRP